MYSKEEKLKKMEEFLKQIPPEWKEAKIELQKFIDKHKKPKWR